MEYSTPPLVNNLKIKELFKDKDEEKGVGVTDFINQLVQSTQKRVSTAQEQHAGTK